MLLILTGLIAALGGLLTIDMAPLAVPMVLLFFGYLVALGGLAVVALAGLAALVAGRTATGAAGTSPAAPDVVLPDGTVVRPDPDSPFTRLLLHPHETEQPFTRSQGGIVIPDGVTQVTVRAHDLVDGFGGQEVMVDLTAASGPDFEVMRAP